MAKKKGQSRVRVYPDWCKGCGICAAFCPSKVMEISREGKAVVVREEECINCGFCEIHCPDFAIVVEPRTKGGRRSNDEPAEPVGSEPDDLADEGKG
jgi:2-oxoglutarate ferredoxin oxidoreductase subunit delta